MNTRKFLTQVSEFHEAMRYRWPEPKSPDLTDPATNKLRPELIREELMETHNAIESGNREEQLDGLCDTQYVISGSVLAWGFREMSLARTTTVTLRKIHDLSGHTAAMLGIARQIEGAANHMFAMQVLNLLCELQSRLNTLVYHLGFSQCFDEAFDVVHANNLGKIWKQSDVDAHMDGTKLVDGALRFEATNGGYVARRADGKILKPWGFTKVSLGRFA